MTKPTQPRAAEKTASRTGPSRGRVPPSQRGFKQNISCLHGMTQGLPPLVPAALPRPRLWGEGSFRRRQRPGPSSAAAPGFLGTAAQTTPLPARPASHRWAAGGVQAGKDCGRPGSRSEAAPRGPAARRPPEWRRGAGASSGRANVCAATEWAGGG